MPLYRLTVPGAFGDVVRGKEGNVGADELFGDVQEAFVSYQPVHEGIVRQEVVAEALRTHGVMFFHQPVDVLNGFFSEVGINGIARNDESFFVVFLSQVGFEGRVHHLIHRHLQTIPVNTHPVSYQ